MIRDLLKKKYVGMNKEFRFRGEEPGRLALPGEGLDAILTDTKLLV